MNKSRSQPPSREEAIEMLRGWREEPQKREAWNRLREEFPEWRPDLCDADLSGADLRRAYLFSTDLARTDLSGADLANANLANADLFLTSFNQACLIKTILVGADFHGADLSDAQLDYADITVTSIDEAILARTSFVGIRISGTSLSFLDLLSIANLDDLATCKHDGPSSIDTHTLKAAKGRLPEKFLRGIGLEAWEVEMAKLYDPAIQGTEFVDRLYRIYDMREKGPIGGVFISYSHVDETFVDAMQAALYARDINVWRDVHDLRAGPLVRQVVDAIRRNDVVLLVMSEAALKSDWVEFEIEKAREREKREDRVILCPVALDGAWKQAAKERPTIAQLARDRVIFEFDPTSAITEGENAERFRKLVEGMKIFYGSETASRAGESAGG